MNNFNKIEYYDLKDESLQGRLPDVVGRSEEIERINRVINRRINNNILLMGPSGIGKTTLVYGWIKKISKEKKYDHLKFIQFDSGHLLNLINSGEQDSELSYVLNQLPACILFIDNFGRIANNNISLVNYMAKIYNLLLKKPEIRIVLTLEPHEYSWIEREYPSFIKLFESIAVKEQSMNDYVHILEKKLPYLNQTSHIIVPTETIKEIISLAKRFPNLGQLPQSGISILDESIAFAVSNEQKVLSENIVAGIISSKVGIPKTQLNHDEIGILNDLENTLNQHIISQKNAIAKITKTLQRAKLGIKNQNRPLGSFLILGPSGVGKTETAKIIAQTFFGRSESFIRFDMSEFGQDHTVQRLIGAPAGYIGYEGGGALTNALKKEPHSLILLDEIEKAHPKVFDIFLQVLDDGRLTSGQNETVDARNSIIMATSNIGVQDIVKEFELGADLSDESFIQEKIIPALEKVFRLEFINRFDSIIIFNPLTLDGLVEIALLEIKKVEKRLAKHKVQFDIDPSVLQNKIKDLVDLRFGARPVKRFIEETCESLLAQSLLNK
ncbi:MAG: AAA family ATPase [Candidatus Paceibacterota bacterium]